MDVSPEIFERFMDWLHPNREEAGEEYQRIRAILLKHFHSHGCSYPEKLADATIDRVAQTLTDEEIENWKGDKARYFFRVGYYILLEATNRGLPEMQFPDGLDVPNPDKPIDLEQKHQCLKKCLNELSTDKRRLIVKYYVGTKAIKILNRQNLARELNIDLPHLRVRALRIRRELRVCLERCFEEVAL